MCSTPRLLLLTFYISTVHISQLMIQHWYTVIKVHIQIFLVFYLKSFFCPRIWSRVPCEFPSLCLLWLFKLCQFLKLSFWQPWKFWGVFSSVQLLSHVQLFVTPWTTAHQASLSITNSRSLLTVMSIELGMPSNRLILCRPLLLPPSIFPTIRVFLHQMAKGLKLQHHFFQLYANLK